MPGWKNSCARAGLLNSVAPKAMLRIRALGWFILILILQSFDDWIRLPLCDSMGSRASKVAYQARQFVENTIMFRPVMTKIDCAFNTFAARFRSNLLDYRGLLANFDSGSVEIDYAHYFWPTRSNNCSYIIGAAAIIDLSETIRAPPAISVTRPPASLTIKPPATTSHADSPRSQNPS